MVVKVNRELLESILYKLEKQQLDEVIKQLSERLDIVKNRIENRILIENKPIRFSIEFAKNKKEDNKLYLLRELGFDFKEYIFTRLIVSNKNYLAAWIEENISKIKLFINNDDESGAIVLCSDGFTYKKAYITVFGVEINNWEVKNEINE